MNNTIDASISAERGATVVITHRVHEGRQTDYENWLNEIRPICMASAGNLDLQIIRPIAGLTATYTIVIRFDTRDHLQGWMGSSVRRQLIEKVQPILVKGDDFFIRSGLDFWFTPEGAQAQVPVRWKQYLATWSAIYPLVLCIPALIAPAMRHIGVLNNRFAITFVVTGTVVFLMVYVVMPNYTKLIRRWLFN